MFVFHNVMEVNLFRIDNVFHNAAKIDFWRLIIYFVLLNVKTTFIKIKMGQISA